MHEVIFVGARCAGSPTAMLLARRGYRVLLVDKARVPSDTLSGHYIHQPGIASLHRWGLLDKVVSSGCPPSSGRYSTSDPLPRLEPHRRPVASRRDMRRVARSWT